VEVLRHYAKLPSPPVFGHPVGARKRVAKSKLHDVKRRLTVDEQAELVAAYAAGASSRAVGQQFGVDRKAVSVLYQGAPTPSAGHTLGSSRDVASRLRPCAGPLTIRSGDEDAKDEEAAGTSLDGGSTSAL